MTRRLLRTLVIGALVVGLAGMRPLPTFAATVSDCPTTESALSTDITKAGGGGTVAFNCAGPITIPFTSTITISQSVTLDASHASGTVTFDGGGTTQLLIVTPGVTLTLKRLTLAHGNSAASGGGAIQNDGTVTISNSTLSRNHAAFGGAISNTGTASITTSTLSGNSASSAGGAIDNLGTLTITSSTLSSNSAPFGGAMQDEGTLTIITSTFSGNIAAQYGGAILDFFGTEDIADSTLSGNYAFVGGAIYNLALFDLIGTVSVGGSIIANSPRGGNCAGTITDIGYNLSDDSSCGFSAAKGDLINTNPRLGPLQNNGGPTPTMALQPTSPAIDRIPTSDTALCPPSGKDQRGYARPDAGEIVCDIGAYESAYLAGTTTTLTSSANPSAPGQTVTFTATVTPSSGTASPTGTVQFSIDGASFGSPVPLSGGKATSQPTSSLAPGSHTIRAVYSGDASYLSSSGSLTQTVSPPVTVPTSTPGSFVSATGSSACTSVAALGSVTSTGSPTGSLVLRDERPGGSPCGPYRAGVISLQGGAIDAVVCTSHTTATIYGRAQQGVAPSTTSSLVSFRADVAMTSPSGVVNGTVSVQTSSGYSSGSLPVAVRITGC